MPNEKSTVFHVVKRKVEKGNELPKMVKVDVWRRTELSTRNTYEDESERNKKKTILFWGASIVVFISPWAHTVSVNVVHTTPLTLIGAVTRILLRQKYIYRCYQRAFTSLTDELPNEKAAIMCFSCFAILACVCVYLCTAMKWYGLPFSTE